MTKTIPSGYKSDFELAQESDLLDEPGHNGRHWFWRDQAILGRD